ncbi:MAG: hypothetical protein Q4G59_10910, partial [Planctomycetia bacterium]|nr:hypothetical protein [Planctomycetia bacterium]
LFKHPEICQKFVRASFRGWKKAFEDKEKAIQILTAWYKEQNMLVDATVSMDQLCAFEEVMNFQSVLENNGGLSRKNYQFMVDRMIRAKLISKENVPLYDDLYYPVLQSDTMERLKNTRKQAQPVQQASSDKTSKLPPKEKGGKP